MSELRRLRQLEEENRKFKQLVADLSLDKVMPQEVLSKKLSGPRSARLFWTMWSIGIKLDFVGLARSSSKVDRLSVTSLWTMTMSYCSTDRRDCGRKGPLWFLVNLNNIAAGPSKDGTALRTAKDVRAIT